MAEEAPKKPKKKKKVHKLAAGLNINLGGMKVGAVNPKLAKCI